MDRLMEDAEARGACEPQRKVPPEHSRFASCTDRDIGVSVPGRVYATIHGRIRGIFADLESVYATQGGSILGRGLIEEFDSLEEAEMYLRSHEVKLQGRSENCSVLMLLERGDGFAMRMSSWD